MMPHRPRKFDESDYVLSSEEIWILGRTNPIVHACLTLYQKGDLDWNQAMMSAVKFLATQNENMFSELARQASERIKPFEN
jgi:hypothetical protein